MKLPLPLATVGFASFLGSASMLHAGTVTTSNDDPSPGSGSLRAVLAAAVNGETIDFAPALDGALITLTNGELPISALTVIIDANALPSGVAISGNNASRILNISSGSNVTLNNLTFRNGRFATGNAGAIQAQTGQLTMSRCVVRDSYALNTGGGIYLGDGVVANLDRCTISGNRGDDFGGGIYMIATGSVIVTNTAITGNRSLAGGGVFTLSSSPTFINTTIQGNSGEGLRGVFSSNLIVRNTIIWGNRTGSGSLGLQQLRADSGATASVDYSLVEGTAATANNLSGTLAANIPKFNISALPANAPTSVADVRLLTGSTSVDAGDNAAISLVLDLAELPRKQGTSVDLGAFEGGYITFSGLYPSLLPGGDENQNGVSNYVEYALGVAPNGNNTFAAMPTLTTSSGFSFLSSNQRINGLDVKTKWQTSTSLETPSWQPMVEGLNYSLESSSIPVPGLQQVVFKILDTDTKRFYRQGFSSAN